MNKEIYDSSDSSEEETLIRRKRIFRERINYNFLNETYEFNERFRLNRHKFSLLVNLLSPRLGRETLRNNALSVELQLQICLHWLGTGSQYHAVSDMHGISKASVCRVVQSVVDAVNTSMFEVYVKWPENVQDIVANFYRIKGMPMVCGCLDGTLIKIDAPKIHEEQYVDRHGNHSISCMVVCLTDFKFYYSYASWPGSAHDARVLRNSNLFRKMESGWRTISDGIILGDSAYPLKDWLIPPTVPESPQNHRFLRAHKSTRRVIENAIGILKEKLFVNKNCKCKNI